MSAARYAERTDGVPDELRLLAAAHATGNCDLAMSLAESAKDTLSYFCGNPWADMPGRAMPLT